MSVYYLCKLRPPGYAQVPDGFVHFEAFPSPRPCSEGANPKLWYHGWVEYAEELPEDKVDRFSLERVEAMGNG